MSKSLITFSRVAWFLGLFITPGLISAKDIYIAQTAQGSGNGTAAANAYAVTWFNTSGNWGSGASQINPGDTVHLCGTITSALTAQGSGTASAQTTIFFEPGANISMPYLPTTGAINLNGYSYITIDGNNNQGWIMASANGSAGPNSVNDTIGINLGSFESGCIKNVTVQNLTVTNMYLLNNASYPSDYAEATGIWMCSWFTNLTIQGCIISQSAGAAGITVEWQGNSDGLVIRSNKISHCNWSIRSPSGSSGAFLTHRTIAYNVIDYMGTEADDPADENHHDGIFLDMPYASSSVNTYVYGNVIGPHCGAHDTAWIYMSYGAGTTGIVQSNVWIYNNIFIGNSSSSGFPGDGFIYLWGVQGVCANNTCVNLASSAAGFGFRFDDSNNVLFLNNIVVGVAGVGCGSTQTNVFCDYNFYTSQYSENLINGGNGTWAEWTAIGGETHTAFGNPEFVSPSGYNLNLQSGSPCIGGSRSNLYAAGVITTDINGVARPSTGNWTMGAYVYGSGSGVDISIGTQPASQSAYVGQAVTLSVAASGGSTLSYQWQTNGVNVSGATSLSWTTPTLTAGWNGLSVDVNVTDMSGTLESSVVSLTVNADPSITAQPTGQSAFVGQTATFSVTASGQSTLSYQWQTNSVNVSGATSSSWTTPTLTAGWNGLSVDVNVTDTAGSVKSSVVSLTVHADPVITAQPQSASVSAGSTATFSVTASGQTTLSYQWQTNGVNVSGATSASWTTPTLTTAWSGLSVDVIVTDTAGSSTSSTAALSVTSSSGNPATGVHAVAYSANAANITTAAITTQTSGSTILIWVGSGALSEVEGKVPTDNKGNTYHSTGPNAYVSYPTSGENLYICTNAAGGSGHTFTWPGEAEMESTIMVVEVKNGGKVVNVMTNAVGTVSGTQTSLYATNTAAASIVAIWAGDAGATSSSATPNNSFNVLNTQALASGYVEGVIASKDLSSAGSNDVTWTQSVGEGANMRMVAVEGGDLSITSQPQSVAVSAGGTATFSVAASGLTTLGYQWQTNGVNVSGATSSSWTTPTLTAGWNGLSIDVNVTDASGTLKSSVVSLTVNNDPSITAQPQSVAVSAGGTATFSVAASGQTTLSYQWQTNGVNVSGATSSSWTTPTLTAGWNGLSIDVNVTDASGTLKSSVVSLTVNADPVITAQPQSVAVSAGGTASFSVTASGQTTLGYQWQTNGVNVFGANSASWTTPTLTTAWSGLSVDVIVTDTAGSLTSSTAALSVTSSSGNPATGVHAVAYSANAANITTAAITTQTSGSTILIWVGSGDLSEVQGKVPTDNKGNTYHSTGPNGYVSYPTSGENLYICTNAVGGSGHTFTWPGEAEVESTIMVVEVENGGKVVNVMTNAVGTVSATQTSLYATNNAPASIVAVWAGDAGATSSSATPNNSFNVLNTQALASGYTEGVTASKDLSSAGTNDVIWTQSTGQGANMRMVAVEGSGSGPGTAPPITWSTPANIVYGTALGAAQLNATSSVGGVFTYTPPAGTVLNAGSQVLSVTFNPANTSSYVPVTTNVTLVVLPGALTITAANASKLYGAALPALAANYSGFVNGDTASSLTKPPALTTTATAASPVGSYSITASGAASSNYTISYASGALTVNKAGLRITAANESKLYGAPLPTLAASYSGFVNGDAASSLTRLPTLTTTATATSPVGAYPITASGAASLNYSIGYVSGTLTVRSTGRRAMVQIEPSGNLAITGLGNGSVAISGYGTPGSTYVLQYTAAAPPATNWLDLGTATADSTGAFVLVDTVGTEPRFYRVINP